MQNAPDNPIATGRRWRLPLSGAPLVWLVVEVVVVLLAVTVLPTRWLLAAFLPTKSIASTSSFVAGTAMVVPDEVLGWRNAPNRSQRKWVTDSMGDRSSTRKAPRADAQLIVVMGSSAANGGGGVTNDETFAAYLESDSVRTLNVGVMLYSFDQVLLAYQQRIAALQPDVIIVGYNPLDVAGLTNMYVPLRRPDEVNMALVKPRFEHAGEDSLNLISIKSHELLRDVPTNTSVLDAVREKDSHYESFTSHRVLGMLPIASSLRQAYARVSGVVRKARGEKEEVALLVSLMRALVNQATAHGTRVVMLMLPERSNMATGGIRGRMPDAYAARLRELEAGGLDVVDGRQILREHGAPTPELFHRDGFHLSAKANQMLAKTVLAELARK